MSAKTQKEVLEEGRTFDSNGIVTPSPFEVWFFNNDTGMTRFDGSNVFQDDSLHFGYAIPHLVPIIRKDEEVGETLTFGVELEYDSVWNNEEEFFLFRKKERRESNALFMIKSDGSLSNGLEAVTQPFSYQGYVKKYANAIKEYVDDAKVYGARATSNCGLHVHIDKDALSEEGATFLVHFLFANQEKVEYIAGRGDNSFCRWREPVGNWWDAGSFHSQEFRKYSVLNLAKWPTVEFRLNAGSTRVSTVLARIEFVMALAEFAKDFTANVKSWMCDWATFKDYVNSSPSRFVYLSKIINK